MSALDSITNELAALETEEERIFSWRHASLLTAGYDHRLALKLALGWDSALHDRLLLWDAKRGDWHSVALKRDPECVVCTALRVTSGG